MPELPILAVFASRLRAVRAVFGVSQADLGARVGIPEEVASTRVNRYERAVHSPDLATAEKLAEELGIPLPALLSRDDGMAVLIAGFAALPKAKRQEVLTLVETLLGSANAEKVFEKLQASTALADAPTKGSWRRL